MSMVADGAAGSTRTTLTHALQAGSDLSDGSAALIGDLASNHDAQIGLANALWTRADLPPSPSYTGLLKDKYAAQAQALHFGDPSAASTINAWTKAHTLGLINHLVDSTDPSDFAYLTNAISFQATWTLKFKKSETRPGPFTPASGTAHDVPMMNQTAIFQTADASDFRVLRLPYGAGGYAAYILLPNGRNADSLVTSLSAAGFDRIVAGLHPERLQVTLPRFTAEYKTSLNETLKSLGMVAAFSSGANFSPMHKPPPHLALTKVDHAAYMRVDEDGTVAAAATSAGISITSILVTNSKPFIVNHPFIFALRDEHSGNILFLSLIRNVPTMSS